MADSRQRLRHLFPERPPLVGMVHLLPLPGAPGWGGDMAAVLDRARGDARLLAGAGFDAVLVENYHDVPFHPAAVPPATVAAMTAAAAAVVATVPVPVGVNVLRNDAAAALAVAVAAGARFIRVNVHTGALLGDQGWLHGAAPDTLRLRAALGAVDVAIVADVLVKHAVPPAGLTAAAAARDAWHRGLADGLIISGEATGRPADEARLREVRAAVPEAPVWIGSGADEGSIRRLLAAADGVIVGTALQQDGQSGAPLDPARVHAFLAAAGR
jgi:uncharacterized protein